MTELTDEAVTIGLDDDRVKFFADRLLEVARIKAATEPYEGECDQEDLASYAGEVVKLRRALLDARAELARVKADAAVAVARVERLRHQITEASDPDFIWGAMDNVRDAETTLDNYAAAASRAIRGAMQIKTDAAAAMTKAVAG